MKRLRLVALLLAACLTATAYLGAEEPPLAVGSEGVPVPKKVRDLKPKYPAEAVAQGIRGIVILDLVIGTQGAVESVSVVRSVPGLDDAAVAAASQWRYEPVKVGGRPARVRLTVPITFSLALPRLARDAGIPELRQGVMPVFPRGAKGGGKASVAVMLASDGLIEVKGPMQGSEEPWTSALLAAIETWRFSPTSEETLVSFRVEAEFAAGKRPEDNSVFLRATGLKIADARSAEAAIASPPAAPATTAVPAPATAPATASAPAPAAAPQTAPEKPEQPSSALAPAGGTPAPAAPAPAQPTPAQPTRVPPTPTAPSPGAAPGPPAAQTPAAGTPAPPPLEVVSAPPPQQPPENGISIVRDVTLEPGVPELAKGRRPVPPPVARMAGATGSVEVAFSVSAAGTTTVQRVSGPDLLKKAAEEVVASWVFRRTRADRAYLVAVISYGEDKATALVRPQPAPGTPSPATPPAPVAAPLTPKPEPLNTP